MTFARALLPITGLGLCAAAQAAPVNVQVVGADGRPVASAIVTVTLPGTPPPAARGPYRVTQRNIAFDPRILIVPVGAQVSFPNLDRVRHHVYSFSSAKKFNLKLYGREESRSVVFDKPGAVALGCNIHDSMAGVVYVTATPFAAATDADGRVTLPAVPAGRGTVSVWHPSIRRADNTLSQPIVVAAAGTATVLRLRP